jgi:hypothetical protein
MTSAFFLGGSGSSFGGAGTPLKDSNGQLLTRRGRFGALAGTLESPPVIESVVPHYTIEPRESKLPRPQQPAASMDKIKSLLNRLVDARALLKETCPIQTKEPLRKRSPWLKKSENPAIEKSVKEKSVSTIEKTPKPTQKTPKPTQKTIHSSLKESLKKKPHKPVDTNIEFKKLPSKVLHKESNLRLQLAEHLNAFQAVLQSEKDRLSRELNH